MPLSESKRTNEKTVFFIVYTFIFVIIIIIVCIYYFIVSVTFSRAYVLIMTIV